MEQRKVLGQKYEGKIEYERILCLLWKKIEISSNEHIIQNALGGLYESTEICCGECNNFISKNIDVPFVSTFNGIISKIPDMVRSNNKKSKPSCTGKALYKGKIYNVWIKAGKVISCPELSRKIKGKIPASEFRIVAYDFPLENRSFRDGMGKIAFNFFLDQGVPLNKINSEITIEKGQDGKIKKIQFDYLMIPFCPLNPFDEYIELETEMELYHNLILFSQGQKLWCYIDLFNTFQYYILLSDTWNAEEKVHKSYVQLLQKLDREIPDMYLRKPKHILAYADFYKIEPCLDVEKFKKRVAEAIRSESVKKNLSDVVSPKLQGFLSYSIQKYGKDRERILLPLTCIYIYFDENDSLREKFFRTVTIFNHKTRELTSYPELIKMYMEKGRIEVRKYTFKKFDRLNTMLLNLSSMDEDY